MQSLHRRPLGHYPLGKRAEGQFSGDFGKGRINRNRGCQILLLVRKKGFVVILFCMLFTSAFAETITGQSVKDSVKTTDDVINLIVSDLKSRNAAKHAEALVLLKNQKADTVVGQLRDVFLSDYKSREAAGEALAAIGDSGVKALTELLHHEKQVIAFAAADQLSKENPALIPVDPRFFHQLMRALPEDNKFGEAKAAGTYGVIMAVRAIIDAMQSQDVSERIAGVNNLLKSSDAKVRRLACSALGRLKNELAIGPLIDVFVNDESNRLEAGDALAAIGAPAAAALLELLHHEDAEVVVSSITSLGEMKVEAASLNSKIIDALIDSMHSTNKKVCNAAVQSLGGFKQDRAINAIIISLLDTNILTRPEPAAKALVRIGQSSVAPLVAALGQYDPTNRVDFARWAAAALGDIGSIDAIDTLCALSLKDWALPSNSKDTIPQNTGLGLPGSHPGLADLVPLDQSTLVGSLSGLIWGGYPKADACTQSIYALARIGKPSLPSIVRLLSSSQAWVRCRAVESLYILNRKDMIIEPEALMALVACLKDGDEGVRKTALDTLKSITKATTANEIYFNYFYASIEANQIKNAAPMAAAYQKFVEENIVQVFSSGSEQQRLAYISTLQGMWHPYCMLVQSADADVLAQSVLHLKGVVLDSLTEDSRTATSLKTNSLQTVTVDAISGKARRAFSTRLCDVQAVLSPETVLLEYICYPHYLGKGKWETRYGVVLIGNQNTKFRGQKPAEPIWVELGAAKDIDLNLRNYAAMMRGQERGNVELLSALYLQVMEPVQGRLPIGITNLIISADGDLNFLSFATLVTPSGEFLAEKCELKYVATGRDLVGGNTVDRGDSQLAVFADPSFSESPSAINQTKSKNLHMLGNYQRDYEGITLPGLPNTMEEAAYLKSNSQTWRFKVKVYSKAEASEMDVKSLHSPCILHLATHGFFLPDDLPTNQISMVDQLLSQELKPIGFHNPMQRSGLAFAGAQLTLDAWKRGETPDTENDGILMAQEVGTMDLKNTWLVVLSACDTGVGEARAGEGVLGLRRGFVQAGAQNLMMTLWPVSDKWTVDLMKAFYQQAMKTKNAPGALASAQREYLAKLRKEKNSVIAARLAGPFIMSFQGKPLNN